MNYRDIYDIWCKKADKAYRDELMSVTDEKDIEDRFYRSLEFGTAGLRGVLGAGTNRMNTHVVRQATKALSDYIKSIDGAKEKGVVIAYDSRRMSSEFAKEAALVLAHEGVKAYLFPELRPVPMLSFAVRHIGTAAGIVITASHNPPEYNGYKVYWSDGGQITPDRCKPISELIEKTDAFSVETIPEDAALSCGLLEYVSHETDEAYYSYTLSLSQNALTEAEKADICIAYSPLHGSGLIPVTSVLTKAGYKNLHVVESQREPDGNFPTVKAPNPENEECFTEALALAREKNADIVLASDPDSDRLGAHIKTDDGYLALTGNKIGSLLIYYILGSRSERGALPKDAYVVRSVVSTPLADAICSSFGVEIRQVLTGFRYIAEQIEEGRGQFLFGFEESYGFLAGTSVRDKDAVLAAMLMCEACAYYKSRGKSIADVLLEIEKKYGAYYEKCVSFNVKGKNGMAQLAAFMKSQHDAPYREIAGREVTALADFTKGMRISEKGEEKLNIPKADVISYDTGETAHITLRPSGTEPKLKVYVAVKAADADEAKTVTDEIVNSLTSVIDNALNG